MDDDYVDESTEWPDTLDKLYRHGTIWTDSCGMDKETFFDEMSYFINKKSMFDYRVKFEDFEFLILDSYWHPLSDKTFHLLTAKPVAQTNAAAKKMLESEY